MAILLVLYSHPHALTAPTITPTSYAMLQENLNLPVDTREDFRKWSIERKRALLNQAQKQEKFSADEILRGMSGLVCVWLCSAFAFVRAMPWPVSCYGLAMSCGVLWYHGMWRLTSVPWRVCPHCCWSTGCIVARIGCVFCWLCVVLCGLGWCVHPSIHSIPEKGSVSCKLDIRFRTHAQS
jgi:hypothetical protein